MSSTSVVTTPHTPVAHVKTRFLIISDTHSSDPKQNDQSDAPFRLPLPKADVLLHCGDLTMIGLLDEYERTLDMLDSIDAELKLVIAGNHDISLDETYYKRKGAYMQGKRYDEDTPRQARELWTGARAKRARIVYLEEGTHSFTLKNGARLAVYASPYQPEFCVRLQLVHCSQTIKLIKAGLCVPLSTS